MKMFGNIISNRNRMPRIINIPEKLIFVVWIISILIVTMLPVVVSDLGVFTNKEIVTINVNIPRDDVKVASQPYIDSDKEFIYVSSDEFWNIAKSSNEVYVTVKRTFVNDYGNNIILYTISGSKIFATKIDVSNYLGHDHYIIEKINYSLISGDGLKINMVLRTYDTISKIGLVSFIIMWVMTFMITDITKRNLNRIPNGVYNMIFMYEVLLFAFSLPIIF